MAQVATDSNISYRNLYLSALIINIIYFGAGQTMVWSSSAIPLLKKPTSKFFETFDERLLVSCFAGGQFLGPIIGGCFMDTLGRKPTTFLMTVFLLVSYVLLAVAPTVEVLYGARVMGGLVFGMSVSVLPVYVAELSDVHTRGTLNSVPLASRSLGYFATYAIGPVVSYNNLILVSAVTPVVALAMFALLPESPHHSISKNNMEKAKYTIAWLRTGASEDQMQSEINETQRAVGEAKRGFRDLFSTRANIRALYISCGLLFFLQMCGMPIFMAIAESLFDLSKVSLSTQVCTLVSGGLMLAVGLMGPTITRRFGYKEPLFISALGMALSLIVFGGHFYLIALEYDMSSYGLVPLSSFVAYICFYSLGFSNSAFSVVGELFAPNVKAVGTSLTNSIGFACSLVSIQLFYIIRYMLGIHFGIWLFALINAVAVPFTFVYVPETSKMSLVEIQELLNRPWFKEKNKEPPVEKFTPTEEMFCHL